jgi:hypothetical protein
LIPVASKQSLHKFENRQLITAFTSQNRIANQPDSFLENIPKNSHFLLQGKEFIKGDLRRKRFLCEEITSKKKYLIHTLAEVIPIFE